MVLLMALASSFPASVAMAEESLRLSEAAQCREIKARAARLACFDEAYGTPEAVGGPVIELPSQSPPPYWERLMRQERSREEGINGFIKDQRLDASGEPEMVLLTRAVRGGRGAVLAISCQERITRLELAIPEPLEQGPVGLTLVNGGDRRAVRWRARNEGWLVQAGRGLPAIRTLRDWLDSDQVRLVSRERTLDGLVFELDDLEQALKPLRRACSW